VAAGVGEYACHVSYSGLSLAGHFTACMSFFPRRAKNDTQAQKECHYYLDSYLIQRGNGMVLAN
jgi:hypothetical protein